MRTTRLGFSKFHRTKPLIWTDGLQQVIAPAARWHVRTDAEWDAFIREDASSAYHPCGTARMGPDADPRAIIDLAFRFRGLDGLRIVDASAIPVIPSANINACVFMMAEKAADLILGRTLLLPEPMQYFKANR